MQTLDLFVASRNIPYPDAVKLDVDGNELRVLIGAEVCLAGCRSVQIEVDDDLPSSEQAVEFLKARGFEVTQRTRHGTGPVSNFRLDRKT